MTTMIAEGFDHYESGTINGMPATDIDVKFEERSPEQIEYDQRAYRMWKLAVSRDSWARGIMFWAVARNEGQPVGFSWTRESEIRLQNARGLISDEVAWARLHPEEYEQKMAAEAERLQSEELARQAKSEETEEN